MGRHPSLSCLGLLAALIAVVGIRARNLREVELEQEVVRLRHLPWLFASRLRPGFHEKLVAYATCMERLYLAVAKVSGRSVVVDSSKSPSLMLLLRWMSRVNPRVLHLVHDSRGVAFSWTKHMLRLPGSDTHMVRYPTVTWPLQALYGYASIPRLWLRLRRR